MADQPNGPTTNDEPKVVYVERPKKPFYKKVWFWILIIVLLFLGAASNSINSDDTQSDSTGTETSQEETSGNGEWDIDAAYAKIENGMTKAQVEEATGKQSESCTESEDPTFGKTEICSYGNPFIDKGSISVTYRQDVVENKTKSTY